jgi:hypothetical protein
LNEKILIFNDKKELIYSTIKDRNVTWDSAMLKELDKKKIIYTEKTVPEIYAALRNINGEIIIFLPVPLIPMENPSWDF